MKYYKVLNSTLVPSRSPDILVAKYFFGYFPLSKLSRDVPFLLKEPKTCVKGMEIEWLLNKGILAKGEFELEHCDCTQQLRPSVTIGHIFLHVVGNECEMSEVYH